MPKKIKILKNLEACLKDIGFKNDTYHRRQNVYSDGNQTIISASQLCEWVKEILQEELGKPGKAYGVSNVVLGLIARILNLNNDADDDHIGFTEGYFGSEGLAIGMHLNCQFFSKDEISRFKKGKIPDPSSGKSTYYREIDCIFVNKKKKQLYFTFYYMDYGKKEDEK